MLSHLPFVCTKEGHPCPLYAVGCTEMCNLERLPVWPNSTDVGGAGAEFERMCNAKVQV